MKRPSRPARLTVRTLSTSLLLMLAGPALAQPANGPWPMFRHDVCHTGQSPNPGPRFTSTGPAPADVRKWLGYDKIRTSPSLSGDGKTLYFGMGFDVCAVDTAQMVTRDCYRLRADVSDSSPAVGADGTVYIGDRDNTLTALSHTPEGTLDLKWRYNHGFEGDIWTSPAIAPNGVPEAGTIYFAHDQSTDGVGMFTAILDEPDLAAGTPYTVKWKHKIGTPVRQSSPAVDRNGIIYLGDLSGNLRAFRDNGPGAVEQCWSLKVSASPGLTASPVISPDSTTLYIGTTASVPGIPMGVTALDISDSAACDGGAPAVKWTYATPINGEGTGTGGRVDQPPAVAHDGKTIYVPMMNGGNHSLHAVTDAGVKKWAFGPINWGSATGGHPVVGSDGMVYVAMGTSVYALDALGKQLWKYSATNTLEASPLIGPAVGGKAVLYVPSRDHNLYAIAGPAAGSVRPTTCWSASAPPGNLPPVASAGPDQSVAVGQTVTFDGGLSRDLDGTPLSSLTFTWTFGAGEGGVGPCSAASTTCLRPTHVYAHSGVYTATLRVSDGQASDDDTAQITVNSSTSDPNFSDSFDRQDSTALGSKWTETAGDLVVRSKKLNNALRGDNTATVVGLSGAEQSASADFSSGDNNTGPRLGVLLRYKDPRNHYRLYRSVGGSSQLRIAKVVNGIEIPLKAANIPNPAPGSTFHLSASVTGSTLKVSMGGVQLTATDSTFSTGAVGVLVFTGPPGTHTADNFCASASGGICP